ncbi:unnamed protein product [Bemisia tabaci]|uniref:Ionotropic receptor n=1 Tax=Bemisia tabaci TaxID=7038 RepID=A0A9P0EZ28_BEMTA|nr:unnamed protein product [Bemisia tabaci]
MFGLSLRTLHLSTFALSIFTTTAIFQPAIKIEPNRKNNSIAFKVCLNTVQLSGRPLVYIVDFHSSSAVQPLIQNLHDSSITTILIRHPEELTTLATQNREMNIIFYVNDPDEILSLILSSVSKPWQHEDGFQSDRLENSTICTTFEMKQKSKIDSELPHYCILVDDREVSKMVGCDEQMTLSTAELEGSEFLSDQNFNFTRSLYMNPIWNSKNYLSFMIFQNNYTPFGTNGSKWWQNMNSGKVNSTILGKNEYQREILSFKFIWRFFKGMRTIICSEDVCDRYNPFSESIISYSGAMDESYFDFAVTNMHRKVAGICLAGSKGSEIYANSDPSEGSDLFLYVYKHFLNLTNFTDAPMMKDDSFLRKNDFMKMILDGRFREMGQLLNLDLHLVEVLITAKSVSHSSFDYSVGVETRATCILTPHSKKIPQFLVPFRSFSPVVWFLIGAVFAIFVLMQHAFQNAQLKIFHSLYSETEIRIFENTSSLLSIYAYFVSGTPPRLILGNLLTGKILFFIFSFSALIISTAFLGVMTTLLTNTVQYPEIESLKDLQDSDFLIQTGNADAAAVFFDGLDEFVKLKARLVSNLEYYTSYMVIDVAEHYNLKFGWSEENHTLNFEHPRGEYYEKFKENVQTILENDVFLVNMPGSFTSKNSIRMRVWYHPQKFEEHLVQECLMTHPVFFSFIKNSFLFDRFNQVISRLLESGHVKKFIEVSHHADERFEVAPLPSEDDEPRPYDLNDLTLGFIGLVIGLFFSFLVFVAEMLIPDFENVLVFKYVRRIMKFEQ